MYPSLSAFREDLNADDPSLIMPQFMKDNLFSDDAINPYTGYSRSFEKSLSPASLKLYEEFESAVQNFETLKKEGKKASWAKFQLVVSERAFHQDYVKCYIKEASSRFYHAAKDGVIDTSEWVIDHPFAAAYATGEMTLSTAGAVMRGTRNAYEVAFHGKQLKSAALETALAFGALKYGAKAIRGVSRLVAHGAGVKKLTLVQGKTSSLLLTKEQPWTIHPGQEWKAKIVGLPQKTGPLETRLNILNPHAKETARLGVQLAKDSNVEKVFFNRGLKKASGHPIQGPNRRPDITYVTKDGKVHQIEVASITDKPAILNQRMNHSKSLLPESMKGETLTIKYTDYMKDAK